ncbi:hypothetical protein M4578_21960, partial [Salipiger sp. P9]|uniref:hypothetical protein n=1 Tax=Salipiger pentaromativorans TaxID=2943193 RepID=UPI0021587574
GQIAHPTGSSGETCKGRVGNLPTAPLIQRPCRRYILCTTLYQKQARLAERPTSKETFNHGVTAICYLVYER